MPGTAWANAFLSARALCYSVASAILTIIMIGEQIILRYFDQNLQMESILPRSGRVVRIVASEDWGDDWHLVKLDEPFSYLFEPTKQDEEAETACRERLDVAHVLIKSRWQGVSIQSVEPTSVFVLLVPDISVFDEETFYAKQLVFVCWGMVNKALQK